MKIHTLQEIQRMQAEMLLELRQTGLSEKSVKFKTVDLEDWTESEIDEAHRWISEIYDGPFAAVKGIRSRHPMATWENMKKLGIKNLPEQKILSTTLKALRKAWMHERPDALFTTIS